MLLGRGLINPQPDADGREFDHGEVVCGELFIACGDAPAMLDPIEETLDPVALAIERRAEGVAQLAVGAVRDVGDSVLGIDQFPDPLGDKAYDAEDETIRLKIIQKRRRSLAVVHLAGCQIEAERQPLGIDQGVDLRRQSASAPTHATISTPFFAPAAC